MRALLVFWATPLVLFWGWFFLSLYDWNFGHPMLSRQFHDLLFQLYGQMFGVDPAILPGLVAKSCLFDTVLLAAILAFRHRRALGARWQGIRARYASSPSEPAAPSA